MIRARTLAVPLVAALAACAPEEGAPPFREGSAAEGRLFFADNCAACHGAGAQGDGPLAEGLDPPPADLTRIAARHGGTFPPDWVMSTINGFHREAPEGSAMPTWGAEVFGPMAVMEIEPGTATPVPLGLLALSRWLETIQR